MKSNHQTLLREVTYDPRLGMLVFSPIEELALLRSGVLASIDAPVAVPAGGVVPLRTPPMLGNQSEVRISFAMPAVPVTFGLRVLTRPDCPLPPCQNRTFLSSGMAFSVGYQPAPANGSAAWTVVAGGNPDRNTHMPVRGGLMPLLRGETTLDMVVYVDHTGAEAFFAGGRFAYADDAQQSYMVAGNNTLQGIEVFASGPGVTVLNATVWRMADTWPDVSTHGRPNRK